VAAEDEATALKAIGLIDVVYEQLPVVADGPSALEKGAPLIHEGWRIRPHQRDQAGGEEQYHHRQRIHPRRRRAGLSASRTKSSRTSSAARRCTMRPSSRTAPSPRSMSAAGSRLGAQRFAHRLRKDLADAMHMRLDRVRVISTYVGGGFGGKGGLKAEPIAVALALKANHRPVKVVFTREEVFLATLVRHATWSASRRGEARRHAGGAGGEDRLGYRRLCRERADVCSQATARGRPLSRAQCPSDRLLRLHQPRRGGSYRGYGTPQLAWLRIADGYDRKSWGSIRSNCACATFSERATSCRGPSRAQRGVEDCLKQVAQAIGWQERQHHPRVTESGVMWDSASPAGRKIPRPLPARKGRSI